jgi:hypothetical protein
MYPLLWPATEGSGGRQGPLHVIEPGATCGPAGQDGLLACSFPLIGKVFQQGRAKRDIEFPDGEHRLDEYPIICAASVGPGVLC